MQLTYITYLTSKTKSTTSSTVINCYENSTHEWMTSSIEELWFFLDNTTILLLPLLSSWVNHGFLPPHIINGDVVSRVDSQQSFLYHQERYYIFFFEISLSCLPSLLLPILSMRDSDNPSMAMKTKNVNLTLFITCILSLLEKTRLMCCKCNIWKGCSFLKY